MLGLENESFFLQIIQLTLFLNDFLSLDLHENSHEVLMRQLILGNENINVTKTDQVLYNIRV